MACRSLSQFHYFFFYHHHSLTSSISIYKSIKVRAKLIRLTMEWFNFFPLFLFSFKLPPKEIQKVDYSSSLRNTCMCSLIWQTSSIFFFLDEIVKKLFKYQRECVSFVLCIPRDAISFVRISFCFFSSLLSMRWGGER